MPAYRVYSAYGDFDDTEAYQFDKAVEAPTAGEAIEKALAQHKSEDAALTVEQLQKYTYRAYLVSGETEAKPEVIAAKVGTSK